MAGKSLGDFYPHETIISHVRRLLSKVCATRAQTCFRSLPKPSPARPQTLQNRGPERPRDVKWTHKVPQTSQVVSKRRPRGVKSRPRAAKSQPSDAQDASKTAPDPSRMEPGEPEDEFLARSLWIAPFDKHQERYCVVLRLARSMCDVFKT